LASGIRYRFFLDGDALNLKDLDERDFAIDNLLLPWKVDIAVRQQIDNLELIAHIERVGVTLFSR
jgi:uncharacterized protein